MNEFSISRTLAFLKYMLLSGKKNLIMQPLLLIIGIVIANLSFDVMLYFDQEPSSAMYCEIKMMLLVFSTLFTIVLLCIDPSVVQESVAKKGLFSRFMTLPVKDSERFCAMSILNYLIMPAVMLLVAVPVGFVLCHIPEALIFHNISTVTCTARMSEFADNVSSSPIIACILLCISTFSLGAYYWHKHPFAKTLGTCFCIQALGVMTLPFLDRIVGDSPFIEDTNKSTITVFLLILSLMVFVASWFVFKKRSIISRAY